MGFIKILKSNLGSIELSIKKILVITTQNEIYSVDK